MKSMSLVQNVVNLKGFLFFHLPSHFENKKILFSPNVEKYKPSPVQI